MDKYRRKRSRLPWILYGIIIVSVFLGGRGPPVIYDEKKNVAEEDISVTSSTIIELRALILPLAALDLKRKDNRKGKVTSDEREEDETG